MSLRRYVWLCRPWQDDAGNHHPGQVAVLIGNHCSMVTVTETEFGYGIEDDGGSETIPFPLFDADAPLEPMEPEGAA
jgi:hypothetical protein